MPLAIVTGRPRRDCERFLHRFDLESLFSSVVCMEDAPLKPDPAPVQRALASSACGRAWMVGDTPDDVIAARRAGVVPIGFIPPASASQPDIESLNHAAGDTLERAQRGAVLRRLDELLEMLQ